MAQKVKVPAGRPDGSSLTSRTHVMVKRKTTPESSPDPRMLTVASAHLLPTK